jgi:uncharacterized membrane protein (DUF485 family)
MHARLVPRIDASASDGSSETPQTSPRAWHSAVDSDAFSELLATKVRCVAPLLGFSFVFIVAMTLLAGYAKGFMGQKVIGSFNVGYLLVLLTYVMCWVVSVLYVRKANREFDVQATASIEALKQRRAA